MRPPIIHIGVHKALSSWLQDQVFTPDGPVHCEDVKISEILQFLVPPRTTNIAEPDWIINLRKKATLGQTTGISAERLSGYPMLGLLGRREIAENIHSAFPDASILIVIREQVSVIQSYYYQYLHDGGSLSLQDFLSPEGLFANNRTSTFDLRYFQYSFLADIYRSLFGSESVVIVPYELFRHDFPQWRTLMENRLQIELSTCDPAKKVNTSRAYAELACHKWLNRLLVRTSISDSGLIRSEIPRKLLNKTSAVVKRASPENFESNIKSKHLDLIRERVGSFFEEDNQRLSDQTGLNLESLGYR
ncbi:hypothetical protein ACUNV4_17865 [Granulosicoccus sp. 3-233]|uniref:hypothetical protein n=1 Tax=Granulosicoccus sp. 3-233 TaxID=3417969 RepID=UPI003D347B2F